MNDYEKILMAVEEFCNDIPAKGFEVNYLETASRMLDYVTTAGSIVEETGDKNSQQLKDILKKIIIH